MGIMNVRIGDGCQKLKVGMGKYSLRDVRETAYKIYYAVSPVLCADLCGLSAQSLAMSIHMGRIMAIADINLYHINFRLQFLEVLTYELSIGRKKSSENSHSRVDVVNVTPSPQYFLRASSANAARFQP